MLMTAGMTAEECRELAGYFREKVAKLKRRPDYPEISARVAKLEAAAAALEAGAIEREKREVELV